MDGGGGGRWLSAVSAIVGSGAENAELAEGTWARGGGADSPITVVRRSNATFGSVLAMRLPPAGRFRKLRLRCSPSAARGRASKLLARRIGGGGSSARAM